jgi:magnesium transporter
MKVLDRFDPTEIASLRERGEFFWLDLLSPTDAELAELARMLPLPALAAEDSREFGQRAKIDDYGERLLLVVYGARHGSPEGARLVEVHMHVSATELVTVHREPFPPFDAVRGRALRSEADAVYQVLDELAESLLGLVQGIEEQVSEIEQRAFTDPNPIERRRISVLRGRLFRLQQVVDPQRDMLEGGADVIELLPGLGRDAMHHRFRDVHDTLVLASNLVSYCRELLAEALNVYLQRSSNRLNEIVARLTILSAVFLPLTLITSYFGQNFGWLVDHIDSVRGFLIWGVGGIAVPCAAIVLALHRAGYLRGDGQ